MSPTPPLHVVAALIEDAEGRLLVAQRRPGQQDAGLWEFPGGKVEPGEHGAEALARELHEELGLEVTPADCQSFCRYRHRRAAGDIDFELLRVSSWRGEARPREGQALRWLRPMQLRSLPMPGADRPALARLLLPPLMAISPEPGPAPQPVLAALEATLASGLRLLQLRAPLSEPEALAELARAFGQRCTACGAQWLIHGDWALAEALGADGVHLPARFLWALRKRPLPRRYWVGVSCHDAEELALAEALGADYVTLSPVQATPSHPDASPLGWDRFAALCATSPLPCYALGGMSAQDLPRSREHGGHGIAGIRGLWRG